MLISVYKTSIICDSITTISVIADIMYLSTFCVGDKMSGYTFTVYSPYMIIT